MLSWHLIVSIMVLPWAIAAPLTALMNLNPDITADPSSAAFRDFLESSANTQELQVYGEIASGDVASAYPTGPVEWSLFLGKAAILEGPQWEGWTVLVRFFILALVSPLAAVIFLALVAGGGFLIGNLLRLGGAAVLLVSYGALAFVRGVV